MSGELHRFKVGRRAQDPSIENYRRVRKRNVRILTVAAVITAFVAWLSLGVNQYPMSLWKIMGIIFDSITGVSLDTPLAVTENMVVFDWYIPRAIGNVTIGAILAMGGAVMQSIIRNPLADSYTTGISSGALLGATLFVVAGFSFGGLSDESGMIVNAFVFSLIPCAVIVVISRFRNVSSNMIVFIGMAVMLLFSAVTTMLNYAALPDQLNEVYRWSIGSMNGIDPDSVFLLVPTCIIMTVVCSLFAERINVMGAGDAFSKTVGLKGSRLRILMMVLVSACTAVCVSFSGTIGFVGLVVPNVMRMFVGSDNRILIPASAIAGAMLMIIADCIARMLTTGGLPVGLVTSLIGGPAMIYILINQKKDAWNRGRRHGD